MGQLKIQLLGSFAASIDATPITKFESAKVRALLAYLAVEAQEAHSREKLVGLLWPEMPEKRARASLSQALYNLRKLIDSQNASSPIITATQQSIQFSLADDVWVDVHHFQAYFEASNNHVHCNSETCPWCAEQLEAASQLYRGDFLEELSFDSSLAFDEWVLFMQQRFQRQVLDGLYRLADYFIKQNEILMALPYAWRQVELDPLDERATRQLMHLLAANNQRSQALVQFERLQVIVANELKVAPELETVALRDQIRDLHNSPTKVKTKGDNLPAFLTPLVGRQQELTEIVVQCENPDCRLLTILGPGGSGKTRLALEVARSSLETFRHGVFFVSLNPVQSPVSILPAIADALDLPRGEQDEYQEQLENFLRDKNLLLVLDGFEHLLEGASLIAEILHKAPGFKVLVTSRTRSNIKGEHLYFLSGMRYPEEGASESEIRDADAVKLLVAGLRRTWPDYEPTPEDLNTLLQICRQVLGMPLGILLAASWGATLRVEEIADMTSQSLDFLAADWTDTPARQRSLRATFDYTWNLLGERERTIFQSLSVFRGAFTRQAARSISDASPYELRALVDRSLILSKTPGWYEVHELLRQYGREKLAQSAQIEQDVCGRHSEYYLGQFAHLGDALKSAQQVAAVSSIDLEHGNYRAAWNWAASQGAAPQLARMLDTLCLYYDLSLRYPDGESACCAAIEGLSLGLDAVDLHLLLARIFTWQSRFSRLLGQSDVASQLMEKSQACLEKVKSAGYEVRNVEAFFLLEQGNTHFYKNRRTAAACYSKALELYRSLNDSWGSAKTLARMGLLAHHAGNFKEAVKCYTESLELCRANGDPRGIANALIESGQNSLRLGLAEQGEQYINEGVAVLHQIGDQAGVARGYFELGRYLFWSGDSARSLPLIEQSGQIFEEFGILDKYIFASIGIGLGFAHLGEYAEAISRVNKSINLAEELDALREIGLAHVILGMAYLGQKNFEQAENWARKSVEQYRELNQKEELSLALSILVYSQFNLSQTQQAKLYLLEILQIGIDIHGVYPILYILFAAALLLIKRDEVEIAIEVSTLAKQYPFVENSCWFEDIAGREIAATAESLNPEVVAAAQKRGQERDIWETAAELLVEFCAEKSPIC